MKRKSRSRPQPISPQSSLRPAEVRWRVPGEFETQETLVLGCACLIRNMPQVFVNLVRALQGRIRVVCLVNREDEVLGEVLIAAAGLPKEVVEFHRLASVSMWARDWCPIPAYDSAGQRTFLALELSHLRTAANEEAEPELSRIFATPIVKVPLTLEGGNILCNGDGICLTSTTIFPKNMSRGMDQAQLGGVLATYFGATQWAYLDPLSGESTGHVDLFCSFLAPDLVVVGQYAAAVDPVNAMVLDRAAEILGSLRTSVGPLRVVRMPMPPPVDGRFRSYTNVAFANDVLLVPLYPGIDDHLDRRALSIYRELMPGREVVGVDIMEMSTLGGGLHCMTCNVCPVTAGGLAGAASINDPERSGAVVA
ncbi:MAG: agmatine deiminase family protein [Verrucomicrobia bacterium]|nr:agmatine deiminase family protein [Verrucomicrobiota bacterium]